MLHIVWDLAVEAVKVNRPSWNLENQEGGQGQARDRHRPMVTFSNAFVLPGHTAELSAGAMRCCVEEGLLQALGFEAWRRSATCLMVQCKDNGPGRTELRPIAERELKKALSRDRVAALNNNDSDAALSPQEDLK